MTDGVPRPGLLVLRSADIHRSAAFYRALGLPMVPERHGNGPEHYAAVADGFVFEVYPLGPGGAPTTGVRLGFRIDTADCLAALAAAAVEAGGSVASAPHESPWGRRTVLRDPDGHTVELTVA